MSRDLSRSTLLLCYGNPGRLDDGLGPAFGAEIERTGPQGIDVEVNYQLTVEDIKAAADHTVILFVDAAVEGEAPFFLRPVVPRSELSFSSHSLEPGHIVALAGDLFGNRLQGYLLGIRGYEFDDFGEVLSPGAQANLEAALSFMLPVLEQGRLAEACARLTGTTRARADMGE